MDLTDFILEHEADDTSKLLLSRGKWPEIDIDRAVTIIECRKRLKTKLPEWYAVPVHLRKLPRTRLQQSAGFSANAGWPT